VNHGTGTSTNAPIYVSDVVENAFPGAPYDFISSAAGVGLPKTFGAQRRAYITLWDEDGLSADDEIGNFSFDPLDHYENDNRAGFYEVFFGTNSTKVSVTGTWIY